jgi:hypothetical protein
VCLDVVSVLIKQPDDPTGDTGQPSLYCEIAAARMFSLDVDAPALRRWVRATPWAAEHGTIVVLRGARAG